MSQLKSRSLVDFIDHRSQEGFTLIELLITIAIITILAGLAMPSMLKQSLKAKQSTAKSHLGSVNRAQQAYRLENTAFADNMTKLQLQVPLNTESYSYSFGTTSSTKSEFKATPKDDLLDAFTGCSYATIISGYNATTTTSLQQSPAVGGGTPATPPSC